MFDRSYKGAQFGDPSFEETALLVHLDFDDPDFAETEQEFNELVRSTGATVTDIIHGKRRRPDSKFFAGSGRIDEIGTRLCQPLVPQSLYSIKICHLAKSAILRKDYHVG